MSKMKLLSFLALSTSLALSGCTTLPVAGPHSDDIRGGAVVSGKLPDPEGTEEAPAQEQGYVLVEVTQPLLPLMKTREELVSALESKNWPSFMQNQAVLLNVGDTLSVSLYESQAGGLFVPAEAGVRPGNFVELPPQTIDRSGNITIPYAGTIKAAGRSAGQIERAIVSALQDKAIEPQAVVSVTRRGGSEVSILGAVNNPQRYPLNFNGEKILDAISRAGGPSAAGYDTIVKLQRGGQESFIRFDRLVQDSDRNIYLLPNDTVYLLDEPKRFNLFGAVEFANEYDFDTTTLTLSEAVGKGGGLNDDKADPSEVYIYRREDKNYLKYLNLDVEEGSFDAFAEIVPVVYKVNLREAGGYFIAQQIPVRDNDVVYVSNAESTELQKFLSILNPTSVTTINTRSAVDRGN
jgi:polysaccharide export outer membrane protein